MGTARALSPSSTKGTGEDLRESRGVEGPEHLLEPLEKALFRSG